MPLSFGSNTYNGRCQQNGGRQTKSDAIDVDIFRLLEKGFNTWPLKPYARVVPEAN